MEGLRQSPDVIEGCWQRDDRHKAPGSQHWSSLEQDPLKFCRHEPDDGCWTDGTHSEKKGREMLEQEFPGTQSELDKQYRP